VSAIIDTGATHTCLPPGTAAKLGLSAVGSMKFGTASANGVVASTYAVRIYLPTGQYWQGVVAELPAASQHADALIGCDVLQHAVFLYNGATGTFSICL
jgi:predicted aspartyl protease